MAEILDEDCLVIIFRNLSETDRINAAMVCRRWRDICARLITSLSFADFFRPSNNPQLTSETMVEILSCCGESLKDISLPLASVPHPRNILELLSIYCPNLRNFRLSDTRVSEYAMRKFIQGCPNLEWVSFGNIEGHFDFELVQLLRDCTKLIGLRLVAIKWFTGRSLRYHTSKKFRALDVAYCDRLNLSYLRGATYLNEQLTFFSLHDSRMRLPDLTAISLMRNLTQLELYVHCDEMDNNWMNAISRRCTVLESLTLVIGDSVTNIGLDAVLELPTLEKLELTDPLRADRGLWGQLDFEVPLKNLHLSRFKLTNLAFFELIRTAPKLENLTLDDCELPNESQLLCSLGRSVLARADKVPLKFLVQRTCDGKAYMITFDTAYLTVLQNDGFI